MRGTGAGSREPVDDPTLIRPVAEAIASGEVERSPGQRLVPEDELDAIVRTWLDRPIDGGRHE